MRKWLWLVLLAVFSPSVWAADLTLDDFAYGIKVDVPVGTAVAALSLPEQVYTSAYRTDLGDIRVFNTNEEPVPHMIRYAQTQSAEAPWRSLAFFPLPEEAAPEAGGYRVFVRTGPDGAVVRVDPKPTQAPSEPARTFLIDLSRVRRSLAQLRLEWQPRDINLMAALAVDASDDLVDWTTIQQRAAITDIRYGGHRLLSNTISLDRSSKRYLRLRQLDSGPPVPLIRIDGRDQPEGRTPIRALLKIDGQPVPDAPGVFEYRTTGAFPVDRVNLIFDQANSMADAILESRNDPEATWTRRFKGLFYRIDVDNTPLTSVPQVVAISMDRHWRLTVDASDSTIGSAIPRLEIGYRPHDLFFIARGSGPFTLAFGSAMAKPLKVNVAALFDGISRHRESGIERWVMPEGKQIVLGGPQRLSPLPKPLPMRQIMLWSVLVAGVLVVAVMAWRLARRLKM
ncbi:MAG: DUF3999 domain-containing protein [Desulfosarcina sp.]|nr:DUF3999 domain-containing protein [Desulfosarcina sp.]MBC2766368.1 DUF3999 domain-containing protein [Desulfosarcina sp.]